jgi:toxin FitB
MPMDLPEAQLRRRAENRRRLHEELERQLATNDISIAVATAGELWKWALSRRWGSSRRGGLDLWLAEATIIPAGLAEAQIWAALTTAAQRRGRPRPLNDAWIAACRIESRRPLLTLNRKDVADVAAHDGLVLLGA